MDNVCNICKDLNNDSSINLKCGHKYHRECILLSIKHSSNECPYCRQYIYIPDIINTKPTLCKGIIKSGKNKGNQCNSMANYLNGEFCGKHSKQH